MSEEKIKDLHKDIEKILLLLPRCTNESDLKKKFREETGVSLNKKLEEINENCLHDFLRFKCRDICDTYRFNKEIKIDRKPNLENDDEETKEGIKKRHHTKKSTAPKLNIPKVGILQNSSFRRSNPQGFNKMKPRNNNNNLINTYKHPNYVKVGGEAEPVDNEYAASAFGLSLADFVPLDSNIAPEESSAWEINLNSSIELLSTATQPFSFYQNAAEKSRPNVRNVFDFPSLPLKNEKIGELFDEPDVSSRNPGPTDKGPLKRWNEVTKKSIYKTPPACRTPPVPPRMVKRRTPMEEKQQAVYCKQSVKTMKPLNKSGPETPFIIMDQVFNDFIVDVNFKLPAPKMIFIKAATYQSINITQYTDPTEFFFQYCEISLCRLIQDMNRFYKASDALIINKENIYVGLMCAINIRGIWARAEICKHPDYSGNVKVFLSDFAYYLEVNMKDMRYLFKQFGREPVKCVKGAFAGIQPLYSTWTLDAIQRFSIKACGKKEMQGAIVGFSSISNTYLLDIREQLSATSSIGFQMMAESLAKATSFNQNCGILI